MRSKNTTNSDTFESVFPHLAPVICNCFDFSDWLTVLLPLLRLVRVIALCLFLSHSIGNCSLSAAVADSRERPEWPECTPLFLDQSRAEVAKKHQRAKQGFESGPTPSLSLGLDPPLCSAHCNCVQASCTTFTSEKKRYDMLFVSGRTLGVYKLYKLGMCFKEKKYSTVPTKQ